VSVGCWGDVFWGGGECGGIGWRGPCGTVMMDINRLTKIG